MVLTGHGRRVKPEPIGLAEVTAGNSEAKGIRCTIVARSKAHVRYGS